MLHNTANTSLKHPADSTGGVCLNFPNAVLPFPQQQGTILTALWAPS